MMKDKPNEEERQEKSRELEKKLVKELWPLLVAVKQKVDRRLVTTLLGLVMDPDPPASPSWVVVE